MIYGTLNFQPFKFFLPKAFTYFKTSYAKELEVKVYGDIIIFPIVHVLWVVNLRDYCLSILFYLFLSEDIEGGHVH